MSTTIVVPTDFSKRSLETLRSLLFFQKETKMRVFLIHGIYLTDSITELLFFNENRVTSQLAGKSFLEDLKLLEEELNGCVEFIEVLLFKGRTQSQFDLFVESCGADRVLIPSDMDFSWKHHKSLDIVPFFKNAKLAKRSAANEGQLGKSDLIISPTA